MGFASLYPSYALTRRRFFDCAGTGFISQAAKKAMKLELEEAA
jgi:hypothetical protein